MRLLPDAATLPVAAKLDAVAEALKKFRGVLITAAPGAGKTMLVPPAVAEIAEGRVLLVEPRRVAARAAAAGIAALHGFTFGEECGFAVRGESSYTSKTKILAVTPGILLRMIQQDPELSGVGAIIFDEFHERSCENDLAFTLALDVRDSLCPEMMISVMSATLDTEKTAQLLNAPVIDAPGRTFPVEMRRKTISNEWRYLPKETARAALELMKEKPGDMLVFLPGAGEIEACAALLAPALPEGITLLKLHGTMPFEAQKAVLRPAPERRIILSTNLAESSLTVPGVTLVIDSGWERRNLFDPAAGIAFLRPCRISKASATQRSGRAGRTAPGIALRLWDALTEETMPENHPPEILDCDLVPLLLSVAEWGTDVDHLRWVDAPSAPRCQAAHQTLAALGLMEKERLALTAAGKRAAAMPVHPRLAAMLIAAEKMNALPLAAEIAALLEERDAFGRYPGADLRDRLDDLHRNPGRFRIQQGIAANLRKSFHLKNDGVTDVTRSGLLLACAFPEWIGRSRSRHCRSYQLAGGRAGTLAEDDDLCQSEFLAIAQLGGNGSGDALIRLAAPVTKEDLEAHFPVTERIVTSFDPESGKVSARKERCIGEVALSSSPCRADGAEAGQCVLREALRRNIAVPPPECKGAVALLERVRFARRNGEGDFPDWSSEKFSEALTELAQPYLAKVNDFASLEHLPWGEILRSALDYAQMTKLDCLYPAHFTAPTGMEFRIDYSGEQPALALQVQQLYGVTSHPCVGTNRLPLRLELLSPSLRPVQITSDLPGFWAGSWKLVRTEMRSRYPKHEWPEDPANAAPMRRSIKKR